MPSSAALIRSPSGGLSASELSPLLHEFIMEFRVGGGSIYRYVLPYTLLIIQPQMMIQHYKLI